MPSDSLTGIADLFLVHNRPIHIRCDDSVTRVVGGVESPFRRSRGYAPQPIRPALRMSAAHPGRWRATQGDFRARPWAGMRFSAIISAISITSRPFEAFRARHRALRAAVRDSTRSHRPRSAP